MGLFRGPWRLLACALTGSRSKPSRTGSTCASSCNSSTISSHGPPIPTQVREGHCRFVPMKTRKLLLVTRPAPTQSSPPDDQDHVSPRPSSMPSISPISSAHSCREVRCSQCGSQLKFQHAMPVSGPVSQSIFSGTHSSKIPPKPRRPSQCCPA